MPAVIDLIHKEFTRLKVIKRDLSRKSRNTYWICECKCGRTVSVQAGDLRSKKTKSCGCLKEEGNNTKHGMTKSPEYRIWKSMLQRCHNPRDPSFKNYGGRGIFVARYWRKNFARFLKDMGPRPGPGYSIERLDNNIGYYKFNCIWATRKTQNRNQRSNHLITFNNKTQCISSWAEELNIPYMTLYARINKYGWSEEKALTA